ncbi:MAG: polysaccharide deacetylase family protein [Clostridia bacterium]|nr:polysaccharide deacetylase family protein [Clostridia bacterium]
MKRPLVMRFPGGLDRALTFSYDDGVSPDKRLVAIFKKYGLKATFNITSDLFSPDDPSLPRKGTRMSPSEVIETYEGMEVAVHGAIHPFWDQMPQAAATYDVIRDRDNLEKLFHRIIRGSAAPYGVMGEKCQNALKAAGIVYCRTTVSTEKFSMPKNWLELPATCHHGNPRLMELADKFFVFDKPRAPQLFYVWGHSYEFDDENNWDVIEKFAEKMSGHEDRIWYATNGEIYDYTEAYDRLVWSVELDRVYNPTFTELWFFYGSKTYRIMPGETIVF